MPAVSSRTISSFPSLRTRTPTGASATEGRNSLPANYRSRLQRSRSSMSHHYSGPDFGFPQGDARLDLTDLYAFPKPGEAHKSILIMNVHPSAVVNPPGRTTTEPFSPEALYELKIDTNGDAVADIAYRVRFAFAHDGSQTATLRRV